jgi:hypothetical protein
MALGHNDNITGKKTNSLEEKLNILKDADKNVKT